MRAWRRNSRKNPVDPNRLEPPEGVPINLPIAGVGVRLAAQITDLVVTLLAAGAFVVLLGVLQLTSPMTWLAIASMLFFVTRIPYYVLSELIWNGQTLGKRLMKIKVVSHDGGPLKTHGIVLRNLMKEAEIFLPVTLLLSLPAASTWSGLAYLTWTLMVLAVPILNPYRRRLGDFMAGTHVVHLPQPILLADLTTTPVPGPVKGEKFKFLPHQLDHYGAFELQTLESFLRAEGRSKTQTDWAQRTKTLDAIVDKIRQKISYADAVPPEDQAAFLNAFYAAQRAHLEQRQLFGDRRADKHHANANETS